MTTILLVNPAMTRGRWPESVLQLMERSAIHPDALALGMTINDVKVGDAATCYVDVGVTSWCEKCDAPALWHTTPITDLGVYRNAESYLIDRLDHVTQSLPENQPSADVIDEGMRAVHSYTRCGRCDRTLLEIMNGRDVRQRDKSADPTIIMESGFGDFRYARGPARVVSVDREKRGGLHRVRIETEWPEASTIDIDGNPLPYIETYTVRRPEMTLHRGGPANRRNYERCTLLIGKAEQRAPVFTEARMRYDSTQGIFD